MARIILNEILERYNSAFGYMAMKVAPRLIQEGFIKPQMFLNIPVYAASESAYAQMTFENQLTSKRYSFGIDELEKGVPAFPFLQKTEGAAKKFIAPPPMVSFTRGKYVVRTAIDRSNADVIENFGNKPYEINIQGILVDVEEHNYPGDLLKLLHEMFEANGTYKVEGELFNTLGIMEVFFDSNFKISFVEGYVDTVKFNVNAIAVQAAEFLIKS